MLIIITIAHVGKEDLLDYVTLLFFSILPLEHEGSIIQYWIQYLRITLLFSKRNEIATLKHNLDLT